MSEFITVGKIVNTHGNNGWVRILPLTDFPERFFNMDKIFIVLGNQQREYHIDQAKEYKHFVLIKFKEVQDINAAQVLKGALLQITHDQLINLPKDTYYIFELIGLSVYTKHKEYLGRLTDVLQTGANDVYIVEPEKGPSILVPALKKVVKKIDLKAKQMVVDLPEGLR